MAEQEESQFEEMGTDDSFESFEDKDELQFDIQELSDFCLEVIDSIKNEDLLATPLNYQICFERLLDNKDSSFKAAVYDVLQRESDGGFNDYIHLERQIKTSFANIKKMLQLVAVMYKNQVLLHDILTKKIAEMKKVDNVVISQNLLSALTQEVHRLTEITQKQTDTLKVIYQESAESLNNADNGIVFDSQYAIYNRRFLHTQIAKEIEGNAQTKRTSSLLMINVPTAKLDEIANEKVSQMLLRNVADMLLRTSRRSDVVAHCKDGFFGILLRQSDLQHSKKACTRLFELIKSSNTFVGDRQVTLEINIVLNIISKDQDPEEMIENCISVLKDLNEQKSVLKVLGE